MAVLLSMQVPIFPTKKKPRFLLAPAVPACAAALVTYSFYIYIYNNACEVCPTCCTTRVNEKDATVALSYLGFEEEYVVTIFYI